mgnify:CR=1 FL=1
MTALIISLIGCDPGNLSTGDIVLSSEAISGRELLDSYKCEAKVDGVEASIPLTWSNIPTSAGSIVNSYLLPWDIDPTVTSIAYGTADDGPWYMGQIRMEPQFPIRRTAHQAPESETIFTSFE